VYWKDPASSMSLMANFLTSTSCVRCRTIFITLSSFSLLLFFLASTTYTTFYSCCKTHKAATNTVKENTPKMRRHIYDLVSAFSPPPSPPRIRSHLSVIPVRYYRTSIIGLATFDFGYGSGSVWETDVLGPPRSVYHEAKIVRKTLISTVL
jgi:hypothetical protein